MIDKKVYTTVISFCIQFFGSYPFLSLFLLSLLPFFAITWRPLSVVRRLSSVNCSHQVSDAGLGEPLVLFAIIFVFRLFLSDYFCLFCLFSSDYFCLFFLFFVFFQFDLPFAQVYFALFFVLVCLLLLLLYIFCFAFVLLCFLFFLPFFYL